MRRGYCGLILGRYSPWRLLSNRLVLAGTDENLDKIARIAVQLPVTQISVNSIFSSLKYVLNDLRMSFEVDVVDAILVLCAHKLIIKIEQLVSSACTLYVLRCYTKLVG